VTPPTNNPGEGNPAAERLRDRLLTQDAAFGDTAHIRVQELDAALLHERRATVKRFHNAYQWRDGGDHVNSPTIDGCGTCRRFLDTTSEEHYKGDDCTEDDVAHFVALDATASEEEARP
jgi:hypothetical protein